MKTKVLNKAKLIIKVRGNKLTKRITVISVFDNRIEDFWIKEQIKERGIEYFLNEEDMKETLNWNLNGDDSKYQFKWGQSDKEATEGLAYIFE